MSGPYGFDRWVGVAILVLGALCFIAGKALDAWDRAKQSDRIECQCRRCSP